MQLSIFSVVLDFVSPCIQDTRTRLVQKFRSLKLTAVYRRDRYTEQVGACT